MSEPLWARLRLVTQARIGLGRAGNGLPTTAELEFRAAHAAARDAVHDALDVDELTEAVLSLGLGEPLVVASKAANRAEYLRRPDLGRTPAEPIEIAEGHGAELVVVLADGLSARAAQAHAVPLLGELLTALGSAGPAAGRPVIATQARVALGDHIGSAFGARAVLVLIGERPGLSVNDSLGAYLTYAPRPGRSDAERNCVSNIHSPNGMSYAAAARVIVGLLRTSFELGESGVRVKDRTVAELPKGEAKALG